MREDREKPKVNLGLGRISMLIEKLLMLRGIQGAPAWEFWLRFLEHRAQKATAGLGIRRVRESQVCRPSSGTELNGPG